LEDAVGSRTSGGDAGGDYAAAEARNEDDARVALGARIFA